jgi:hypothetical protein
VPLVANGLEAIPKNFDDLERFDPMSRELVFMELELEVSRGRTGSS